MPTNPRSAKTRHPSRDLAATIREQITSQLLEPGTRLPTTRDLASQHGVSVTSAVRAVELLREEGLVVTTHGRGSYVATRNEITRGDTSRYAHPDPGGLSPNRGEAAADGYRDEVDMSERSTTTATPELAQRLGIAEGAELSRVRYRWIVGGTPTQVSIQWEPLDITRGTSAEIPSSKTRGEPAGHARFAAIGWKSSRVVEEYRARMPIRNEAELLELPQGTPVIAITRFSYAINGGVERIVETADIIARGDRVVIRSESAAHLADEESG
ncbi:MAG: GntR family transcriptional regulator [Streptosporangiales bacterium]